MPHFQGDCKASYQPLAASASSLRLMPLLVKEPLCRPCCKQPLPATLPASCWLLPKPPVQVQVQSHETATAAPKTMRGPVQKMTWTATIKENDGQTHHQKHVLAHGALSSLSLSCCCLVLT